LRRGTYRDEAFPSGTCQRGGLALNITFYGVRGSTPCSCAENQRYGGNTACVAIEEHGHRPIVLDLGTGLRFFGLTQPQDGTFDGVALVSHLHWDHVQGLPFFAPVLAPGARLDIYAPAQGDGTSLSDAIHTFLAPPFFPVTVDALPGTFTFNEVGPGSFELDGATITVADVPHVGPTVGYRVERGGASVAYVSDHQQPGCGAFEVSDAVVALCEGVDLLIHDAQYTDDEFVAKADWGHCTVDYAVEVAARAGARRLALFHHDPLHHDAALDHLGEQAARAAARRGVAEVLVAAEGMKVSLGSGGGH
jgi:phosphoribosyl 1,2-cyclic phosphodiesterase